MVAATETSKTERLREQCSEGLDNLLHKHLRGLYLRLTCDDKGEKVRITFDRENLEREGHLRAAPVQRIGEDCFYVLGGLKAASLAGKGKPAKMNGNSFLEFSDLKDLARALNFLNPDKKIPIPGERADRPRG